ncbi:MAG TPA: hypothetical protein VMP08_22970 [Anaerolineae bacterium]|nr:hypothetical protein [Anaerolineae bacterium]
MGCLLNPLIILLAVIGLVAAVILLGLAAVTSSVTALSNSLAVLSSQCVMGLLAIGGVAFAGVVLALRQPLVQALLIARFKLPLDQITAEQAEQVTPQALPAAEIQPQLAESPVAESLEYPVVVRQAPTVSHRRRRARLIDANVLKEWGW